MCAQVAMENDCPAVAIEHASHAAALQPTWPLAFITLGRACRNAGMRSGIQFRVFSSTIIFAAIHIFLFLFAGNLRRASAAFTTALSLLDGSDVRSLALTTLATKFYSLILLLCTDTSGRSAP